MQLPVLKVLNLNTLLRRLKANYKLSLESTYFNITLIESDCIEKPVGMPDRYGLQIISFKIAGLNL